MYVLDWDVDTEEVFTGVGLGPGRQRDSDGYRVYISGNSHSMKREIWGLVSEVIRTRVRSMTESVVSFGLNRDRGLRVSQTYTDTRVRTKGPMKCL